MKLTSRIYQLFKAFWSIWPLKKFTVLVLRKFHLMPRKYERDFWFEGDFCVYFGKGCLQLSTEKLDHSSLDVFWQGLNEGWDAISLKVWSRLAERSEVIFDVGANIGLYALTAGISNPKATIHAFEPGKKTREILKKNIHLNKLNIQVHECALSNVSGIAEFHDLDIPSAVSSLHKEAIGNAGKHGISYSVSIQRLDEYLEENHLPFPNLISIDVERHERQVLEGMGQLLAENKPNMIIEVLDHDQADRLEEILKPLSYHFFRIDEKLGLVPTTNLKRPPEIAKESGYNFLVCNKESLSLLDDLIWKS